MIKVIEASSFGFVRFPFIAGEKIKPGMIVQLVYEDEIYCKISDGRRPFGLAIGNYCGFIKIMCQKMLFRTNIYDHGREYSIGDLIYVNMSGLLTNEKYCEECQLVGAVKNIGNGNIEVNWI